MHPDIAYELAKLKIAESLADAQRERLIRAATPGRPSLDMAAGLRRHLDGFLTSLQRRSTGARPAGA
jgi:hypothetical protein